MFYLCVEECITNDLYTYINIYIFLYIYLCIFECLKIVREKIDFEIIKYDFWSDIEN